MIWQLAMLSKASDEDSALWIVGLTLVGYVAYKLVFKSRVESLLNQLEQTLSLED